MVELVENYSYFFRFELFGGGVFVVEEPPDEFLVIF